VPTARALRDAITNALDFFLEAELILFPSLVAMSDGRVTWQGATGPFRFSRGGAATIAEYLDWLVQGQYSAILPDASLLQLSYDFSGSQLIAHRLAYIPCPVDVDEDLITAGEAVEDVVRLQLDNDPPDCVRLRSPIRFDFDLGAASDRHPAAHLTLNSSSCRIACVAPVHPYRFLDFVYRHFYPEMWAAQADWFSAAESRGLGDKVISDADGSIPHINWPVYASS
jgi:hypothetical protein